MAGSTNLRPLIEQLAAPLQDLRDRAREALIAGGDAAVPALIEALGHRERDVRAGAALCLGALRATRAARPLAIIATSDPDRTVRPLALRALSDLAAPGCSRVILLTFVAALGDEDMFSRALACTGLGRIGDEECRQALRGALKDREDWVRAAAHAALAAQPAMPPAPATGGAPAATSALMVRPAGSVAPHPAVGGLASLDLARQREAQAALVGLGAEAVPQVSPLLHDSMPHTRRAAAELLGSLGAPEGLEPLLDLLAGEDAPDDLRAVALHSVASLLLRIEGGAPDAELVTLLRAHLERDDVFVSTAAACALIAASPSHRQLALAVVLEEDEEWARVAVARVLRQAASPLDRPLLPAILDHLAQITAPDGQEHLLEALQRILAEPTAEDARAVMGQVGYFLESEHAEVRRSAAKLAARVAREPDPRLLRALLAELEQDPTGSVDLLRALPRLCGPGGEALAVPALRRVLLGTVPAAAREAAAVLAGIGGRAAIDLLVEVANSRSGQPTALAAQTLAGLDPRAEVVAARLPDGRWERRILLRCACGGELRWVERQGREELRCPQCDLEYALSPAEKLFPAERTPFGLCLCAGCRRKQPLVRRPDADTLVCPVSGEVHVRPFDHPRQLQRLADLPLGACACCDEPQPLIRIDEEVRCYRTRSLYRASGSGFEPASEGAVVAEDVAAINRALLLGTLGIAESGLAATDDDPDGEHTDE